VVSTESVQTLSLYFYVYVINILLGKQAQKVHVGGRSTTPALGEEFRNTRCNNHLLVSKFEDFSQLLMDLRLQYPTLKVGSAEPGLRRLGRADDI